MGACLELILISLLNRVLQLGHPVTVKIEKTIETNELDKNDKNFSPRQKPHYLSYNQYNYTKMQGVQ